MEVSPIARAGGTTPESGKKSTSTRFADPQSEEGGFHELCQYFDSNGLFRHKVDTVLSEVDRTLEQFSALLNGDDYSSSRSGGVKEKSSYVIDKSLELEVQLQEAQLEKLEAIERQKDDQLMKVKREVDREKTDSSMQGNSNSNKLSAALTPGLQDLRTHEDKIRLLEERILASSVLLERCAQQNNGLEAKRKLMESENSNTVDEIDALEAELARQRKIQLGIGEREERRRRAKLRNEIDELESELADLEQRLSERQVNKKSGDLSLTQKWQNEAAAYDNESQLRIQLHLLKAYIFNVCEDVQEIDGLVQKVMSDPNNNHSPQYRQSKLTNCFLDVVHCMSLDWRSDAQLAYNLIFQMKVLVVTFDLFEDHVDFAVEECIRDAGVEAEAATLHDVAVEATRIIRTRGRGRVQTFRRQSSASPGLQRGRTASNRRQSQKF